MLLVQSMMLGILVALLSACSTNPATGQRQFTALMSPAQENQIGAQQHEAIVEQFGGEYDNPKLQAYVRELGARVAKNTERADVKYKFYLLDTPVLNAFAVPGGYIYTTRGVVAAANSEAELAGVLAHEVGHITGRHSAERYSKGILTAVGVTVASAAIGNAAAARALGIGANLYSTSYSRGQESQADELGVRYLHRSGYDTFAMAGFLGQLEADHQLQQKITGKKNNVPTFFSTHPNTAGRVVTASQIASTYPKGSSKQGRNRHMSMVNGMMYGDSSKQGFARGQKFYHPELGFTFTAPNGYRIVNQTNQVLSVSNNGSVVILDVRDNKGRENPYNYIRRTWFKGEQLSDLENTTINGMRAATGSFDGQVDGRAVKIRVVAIEYSPTQIFRFQLGIPQGATAATVNALKNTTYSFRRMTAAEKKSVRPQRVRVVTARNGDSIKSLSNRMDFANLKVERFIALNGLESSDKIVSGRKYKIVVAK